MTGATKPTGHSKKRHDGVIRADGRLEAVVKKRARTPPKPHKSKERSIPKGRIRQGRSRA